MKTDLADARAKLATMGVKLKEQASETQAEKKRADAALKVAAKYKQQYEDTRKKLEVAEQNLKKKEQELQRLEEAKNEVAKSKKRVQVLDARSKAVMLKIVKTGEAAKTALELFEQRGGNKIKDHGWNPRDDELKAQAIMNEVVANDYSLFPGDKDVFTTKDDVLFGKQDDGTYVLPPQGDTGRTGILKEFLKATIVVKGEVSALPPAFFPPIILSCNARAGHKCQHTAISASFLTTSSISL
jgi:hypothetical protein